jgi:murein DD-endopeptidase
MLTKHLTIVLLCICSLSLQAQVKFVSPLHGMPGKDYWIVNYVDHDAGPGLLNYTCGNKTYDGHQGTDFLIRSFKTMDSGVVVYAMADGVVFQTKDSLYDRNKHQNTGGLGNYVGINHGGQYWAYYGHFKAYTILVKPGDVVTEGQAIGMIGSSGNATDPHVHIEVYDINSQVVDPFAGACQTSTASVWKSQPAHDTSLVIIDKGFTPYVPDLDTLRERYNVRNTIYTHSDTAINFWIQLQGMRAGDVQRVDWYTPSGTFWFSYSYTTPQDYWYAYFWTYINIPPDTTAGLWNAKYYINNQLTADEHVMVLAWAAGVQEISAAPEWSVYPNPANSFINLHVNSVSPKQQMKLVLYNALGQQTVLYNGSAAALEGNLALPNIPTGLYTLQLWLDDMPAGKKKISILQ